MMAVKGGREVDNNSHRRLTMALGKQHLTYRSFGWFMKASSSDSSFNLT